jgi:hypothetical protein
VPPACAGDLTTHGKFRSPARRPKFQAKTAGAVAAIRKVPVGQWLPMPRSAMTFCASPPGQLSQTQIHVRLRGTREANRSGSNLRDTYCLGPIGQSDRASYEDSGIETEWPQPPPEEQAACHWPPPAATSVIQGVLGTQCPRPICEDCVITIPSRTRFIGTAEVVLKLTLSKDKANSPLRAAVIQFTMSSGYPPCARTSSMILRSRQAF